jgi:hypothetical protein
MLTYAGDDEDTDNVEMRTSSTNEEGDAKNESQAAGNDGNADGGEIDITVGNVTVNVNKTLFVKFKDQKGLEMGLENALLMLQVLSLLALLVPVQKYKE